MRPRVENAAPLLMATVALFSLIDDRAFAQSKAKELWVDTTMAKPGYGEVELMEALAVRLPEEWRVMKAPPESDVASICRSGGPEDSVLRVVSTADDETYVEVVSCGAPAHTIRDRIDEHQTEADAIRRAAVLAAMAVDASPEKGRGEDLGDAGSEKQRRARSRTMVSLGLSPGLTAAPANQQAVFTGYVDFGALFVNGIWLKADVDISTRYVGTAKKKNEDADEAVRVGVMDVSFSIGVSYRLDLSELWCLELGLAGRYAHAVTKDLTDGRFTVEERNPAARGSAVVAAGAGFAPFRFLWVFVRVMPAVSFGRRVYSVRGEDAVDLGFVTVGANLGMELFF